MMTTGLGSQNVTDGSIVDADVATANKDGAAGTACMRTLGTAAQVACAGNDVRLSDARTPLAHKDSHKSAGGDQFLSTDLLEAQVKRILENGGQSLLVGVVTDGQYLKRSGTGIVGDIPAGGSGAAGSTSLDFGAFPGKSDTSVDVIGQASIVAGSIVEAWIRPVATADHTADEHMVETLEVTAGNIVAGTGFTVYAFNRSQLNEPVPDQWAIAQPSGPSGPERLANGGGRGTRIWGLWTVAWRWS